MYCRNCGSEIEENAKFCKHCGAKQFDDTPEKITCKHCGAEIDSDCIVCPHCGKQVAELKTSEKIVINNNVSTVDGLAKKCNKWTSFFLCLFFGFLGAHKFYEGKVASGIWYLLTLGFAGFGWIIDLFSILFKPNPYYVIRN